MKQGSASIKKIQNGKLLIAAVKLGIDNSEESEIEFATNGEGFRSQGMIEKMPSSGYESWRSAVTLGANYALSIIKRPLHVKVTEVSGLSTDTAPRTISAVTAMAIFSALDVECPDSVLELLRG